MPKDAQTFLTWIRICLIVAAICATAFPVLFLFSPWYKSRLGRAFMFQSVVLAFTVDMTLVFQFKNSDEAILMIEDSTHLTALFWVNGITLTLIALATARLTYMLWILNYRHRTEKRQNDDAIVSTIRRPK